MDQQHMCLILLKIEQSAFTQAYFSSLSDVHESLDGLQIPWQADSWLWITTRLVDKFVHGFSCFLWYVHGGKKSTNGSHLAVFSEDVAFVHHFVAPHLLPTLQPYRSASGICYVIKETSYLKWQWIQIVIWIPCQCIADTVNYLE